MLCVTIVLCAWFYASRLRGGADHWFTREPNGYYPLMTAGFRAGHTYLPLVPHPALLALKDPYDPVANAPYRAHDVSLWKGRYYLYFGVTPVLLLFWPVAAATGWYPTEVGAVALFAFAGFVSAVVLLAAIRRRSFPAVPAWLLGAGAVCLAFGSPIFPLTAGGRFYEVPITCAFFLQMLMLGAIYRALTAPRRVEAWLAVASLLFGLSVGARPNYLFGGSVLVVLFIWALRRSPRGTGVFRTALALFGPAAACGAGILIYNWQRFGSPLEFGVNYDLMGEDLRGVPMFAPVHFRPNSLEYLLKPGTWQRYFPFFTPVPTKPYGFLLYFPWCWLAPLAFLRVSSPSGAGWRERPLLAGLIALVFFANLLPLTFFIGANDRYMGDFVPAALLLGSLGALALAAKVRSSPGARRLAAVGCGLAALFTVLVGLCVYVNFLPGQAAKTPVARAADWPAYLWERARHEQYGALHLQLVLPAGREGLSEPIFETGALATRRDWLQLNYLARGRAQFGFYHAGVGLLNGAPFVIPANRVIELSVACGSLMPPADHPYFRTWTPAEYERASRDLEVQVNGETVLRAAVGCYPSSPETLRVGRRGWLGDGVTERFTGTIRAISRSPLVRPVLAGPVLTRRAPFEQWVVFPADRRAGAEPLVATGHGAESDLLYCIYEGGRIRFGLNHSELGGLRGESFPLSVETPHHLTVWLGSLADEPPRAGRSRLVPASRRVFVRMDGTVVLNEVANFYPADPASVTVGVNPFTARDVDASFTGMILSTDQPAGLSTLPELRSPGEYGAVDLRVQFPLTALGSYEPLVVTGVTGAGDIISVKYVDRDHVQFTFDHWGTAGTSSRPIQVDYAAAHRLEINMGSLYPAGEGGAWAKHVRVKLDGTAVIDAPSACYPSLPDQIQIAKNPIGGSTCGPVFTGRVLSVARP